ncbi:MAG: hypothetical protein IPM97_03135 [Bdellovibrionaceae bacterium]|nr:hypothetical protein [Pseudobdellovibrionaceae bacterium]
MKILTFCLLVLVLVSCAHHRDVRPSSTGEHVVKFNTESKEEGYRNAMSQAEDYCKELQKRPVIVNEKSDYTGTMKEETYNNSKKAAKVAEAIGSAGMVFGGKNERNAGGVVGLGGAIADGAIGSGYTYTLVFRCQ